MLRAEGLTRDCYGDAVAFFGISDRQAHLILCNCYFGETASARDVAARVRHAAIGRPDMLLGLGMVSLFASMVAIAMLL